MIEDISDHSVGKVPRLPPLSVPEGKEEEKPKIDSGASTIEKSKAVKPEITPPINSPILAAPSNQESIAFAVASVDAAGKPMTETLHSFILKGEEIKQSILEGWMKNLREIEEYVRQLLASPVYQQLEEIRRKGDPQSGIVSGVQGAASANAAQRDQQVELLSTLDRLQAMERVPSSAEVSDTSGAKDSSHVLILPLTAALLAGGGVAIGTEMVHGASPLGEVMELINRLQPVFPAVNVQDIVPLINLMVVGPIYFNSWNEAISNLKSRERQSHVPAIHHFAKDVIKIVTDPNFVNHTLIQRMKGTEHLSAHDQDRLARMLKVVLIGVSLSLLYSVEVGKVQNGQFGGMMPEELKALLLGEYSKLPDPNKKGTEQEQLTSKMIQLAWGQLNGPDPLSIEDRMTAVEMLLDYVMKQRDLDPMLDPARVFDEAISYSQFDPKDKMGMMKI